MKTYTGNAVVDDRGNIIIDANSDGSYILRKTYEYKKAIVIDHEAAVS